MFKNKSILITGGTGSFGQEFTKYICDNYNPKRLIIFSRDEYKQSIMQREFDPKKFKFLRYFLGDIRDKERLNLAFIGVDYVIHAAALKQIDKAEYNPMEYIKTNINGSENVIKSCIENKVKKAIILSTDKAANPINLYGSTKLVAEKIFISSNNISQSANCAFSVVRYGNVYGSRGSAIPYFRGLAEFKKTIPLTHKDTTRFFMKVDDAVNFVVKCILKMKGGETFVPKMKSAKIYDVIKGISAESKIKIIGLRPGEKVHEILLSKEECSRAIDFGDHIVIYPLINFYNKKLTFVYNKKKYKFIKKTNKTKREISSGDKDYFMNIKELNTLLSYKTTI